MLDLRPTASPNRRTKVLCVIAAAFLIAAGIAYAFWSGVSFYDFYGYYVGGVLEHEGHFYRDDALLRATAQRIGIPAPMTDVAGTPVLVALVFTPLSFLSMHGALIAWGLVVTAALIIASHRALGDSKTWPLWLIPLLASPAFLQSQKLGNPSTLTFALLLFAYGSLRNKAPTSAGVALGIAIALRAYPILFLVPLIAKKDWQSIRAAVITGAALLIPTLAIVGWRDSIAGLEFVFALGNVVQRWHDNMGVPWFVLQFVNDDRLARIAGNICLLGFVAFIFAIARKVEEHILFAITLPLVLLSLPYSWHHYFAVTFLLLLAGRDFIPASRGNRTVQWLLIAILFMAGAGYAEYFPRMDLHPLLYNVIEAGGALLLSVTIYFLASRDRAQRPRTSHRALEFVAAG